MNSEYVSSYSTDITYAAVSVATMLTIFRIIGGVSVDPNVIRLIYME